MNRNESTTRFDEVIAAMAKGEAPSAQTKRKEAEKAHKPVERPK